MTTTRLEWALSLANEGFFIFPISAGKKSPPALTGWQDAATRDETIIRGWWELEDYNIGISTSRFGPAFEDGALVVMDIDTKGEPNGFDTLLRLELEEGRTLPETRTHLTPTGGRHLFYRHCAPVRQGAHVLGRGLDVRSKGGYVVGPGSQTATGCYAVQDPVRPLAPCPDWIIQLLTVSGDSRRRVQRIGHTPVIVDPAQAEARVIRYLENEAPPAIEGEGGDDTTYKVIQRCKDLGITREALSWILLQHYNPKCSPEWAAAELQRKVDNAYQYGVNPPGAGAPEADFLPVPEDPSAELHPYKKLNREYAFVLSGGGCHILRETADHNHRGKIEHLDLNAFKLKFAPEKMVVGKKESSIANQWIEWKGRRSYDGIVFEPGQEKEVSGNGAGTTFFNLWRGFAYQPAPVGSTHPAVNQFLEHTRVNVCGNDAALYRWLLGYFAHLVQRPWEKPLVALVFRGGKGVGKNACIERIGDLLGRHFLVTSNRRYLVSNFNGHLENTLLFALDEAFWSGDKPAEGILKGLITSPTHYVEHKGKEPYEVANKTRVAILGNEDWLIPASHDERRFAVFNVGDGRKQDRAFFQTMREGMEQGGYPVLLRTLLDVDLTGLDFNEAPNTQGLAEQKVHGLNIVHQWWLQCLEQERVVGSEFEAWPAQIEAERCRLALQRFAKERRANFWNHEDVHLLRHLKKCVPSIGSKRARNGDGVVSQMLLLPSVATCRAEWDSFLKHPTNWEVDA